MKKFFALMLALAMSLSLVACGGSSSGSSDAAEDTATEGAKVVKIGVYEPQTGDNGAGGKQEILGIEYAHSLFPTVEIGGETYDVELVIVDNRTNAENGPSAAAELINRDVSVVLGSYGSGVSMAGGEVFAEAGVPVAVNGEKMKASDLIVALNKVGGTNGIGLLDVGENRLVGMKSRGVYETPAGTILSKAHRGLEEITLDREVMHLRDSLIPRYADMIYNGFWFAPERELLQVMITESQKYVTGDVRVKLYKGSCYVTGRRSEYSLYDDDIASFEGADSYDHKDAAGFIKLNALRLRVRAKSKQRAY